MTSALITAPIARLDNRVRVAASLLRAASPAEHLVIGGMALASAAAGWPLAGALYPAVAIPALLALAALIRHHLDGLGARRDALAAAGANSADALVIQVAGPLAATGVGAAAGLAAAVGAGRGLGHALVPLVVGLVAALVVRRAWIGAPALAFGSAAAFATAAVVRLSASPAAPVVRPRSRLLAPHAHHAAWLLGAAWPTALAAVLALAAAQFVIARRESLRALGRTLAAAAARRLFAGSGA